MKKVVLFRSASEEYEKAFRDKGYVVSFVEPLQFSFINQNDLNKKLDDGLYDGLVLTSPRAIEAVSKCWDPTRFAKWNAKRVYTVGEASSVKIKAALGLETRGASSGNAENLAHFIVSEQRGKFTFLFPCGNLSSETLPSTLKSNGIDVDPLTVYETKENENLKCELVKLNDWGGSSCCLVFFSPSGFDYIHRQLQTFNNNLASAPHFSIGNSTAHKIQSFGIEIAGVAEKPKAESVLASIDKYFESSSPCQS